VNSDNETDEMSEEERKQAAKEALGVDPDE
jgi:hypothetical protein